MSEILKVVSYDSPILREKCQTITKIDATIKKLVKSMISTMYANNGIGLAAPQVGFNLRLFVMDLKQQENQQLEQYQKKIVQPQGINMLYKKMPLAIINPEITHFSDEKETLLEGCLSLKNIFAPVERPENILLSGQLLNGKKFEELFCDKMLARCIQHEFDHLNGILYIDRIEKKQYKKIEKKLVAIAKQSEVI